MALVNENFLELPQENMFASIRGEVEKFKVIRPSGNLIDLSVNDVTHSLGTHVAESMRRAVDEMAQAETFRGYGPEQGYGFLREAIIKNDFNPRGIHLTPEEIFVNDGITNTVSREDTDSILKPLQRHRILRRFGRRLRPLSIFLMVRRARMVRGSLRLMRTATSLLRPSRRARCSRLSCWRSLPMINSLQRW